MSKYHSKKTTVDGITFDSKKEANRYCELKLLEKAGVIKGLFRQVKFELIPKHTIDGITIRATRYIADFTYYENGNLVVEDVKGYRTAEYKRKKKQMLEKYGIEIKET